MVNSRYDEPEEIPVPLRPPGRKLATLRFLIIFAVGFAVFFALWLVLLLLSGATGNGGLADLMILTFPLIAFVIAVVVSRRLRSLRRRSN